MQFLPIGDRAFVVLALEGGGTGKGKRFPLHRVDLERPLEQRNRFIIEPPAFTHRHGISVVGEHIRVIRKQCRRASIRGNRLGIALHHDI